MTAKRTIGTTLSKGGTLIGSLTSIKVPEKSRDSIEVTTLDAADDYKDYIPGPKDGGEVTVTGYFDTAEAGQLALDTAFESGAKDTYIITFPPSIGVTFTFSAIIIKFTPGEVNLEDPLTFEVTLKVCGKPVLATAASAGIAALTLSGGGTLTPATSAAVGTYSYTFTAQTSITVTATAANHTIKLYVDDTYIADLTSGSASPAIIGFSAAGISKKIALVCYETGKSPKIYIIAAVRTT